MSILEAISAAAKNEVAKEFEKINEIKENKEVYPYHKIRHDIAYILENSYDVLLSENEGTVSEVSRDAAFPELGSEKREYEMCGLTDIEKKKIKEETGWSDEIVDNIDSMEEYEIYKNAGLKEVEIGGKPALIRDDIDWDQTDEKGKTNAERIKEGKPPLDKDGNAIQLHHIGQHADSPLAELTLDEHRRGGNDGILHNKTKPTEVHGEGNTWTADRSHYWKERAEYNENNL